MSFHSSDSLDLDHPLLEALSRIVDDAVQCAVAPLIDEIAALRVRIQRPDLVKYSIPEAADRMKRSRSSIYDLIKAGELTPVKERGRTFLTEEEIQRWERVQRN